MIEFIEWTFSDWEHFAMVLILLVFVGGSLRPRIIINLPKSEKTDTVRQ